MAFDGIVTYAMAEELKKELLLGKIDKVYQPGQDELVLRIYTRDGNKMLFSACESFGSSLRLIEEMPDNPETPLAFCMLLRKHLSGGRIKAIEQKDSERIIEFSIETLSELGFEVTKKLIFEIMGKHSNVVLVDSGTGKILDAIKHISIDVNRARQLLPGKTYEYPPAQNKIPFKEIDSNAKYRSVIGDDEVTEKRILSTIGGISPAFAAQLAEDSDPYRYLAETVENIRDGSFVPRVYIDEEGTPREFHVADLSAFESAMEKREFDSLSECVSFFFDNRERSNRARQRAHDLIRVISSVVEKQYLKKQRLLEDIQEAENSDDLRLYGELLTANMHLVKQGMKEITLENYYGGDPVTVPLDPRYSPNKNAQNYFKKYGKAKTALKEKAVQLEETEGSIEYLESVLTFLENADDTSEIETLREELEETGYIRVRRKRKSAKKKRFKATPMEFTTSDGFRVLVGKNNRENDILTFDIAGKNDVWFHTKDIPGSHVIVKTEGREITDEATFEAAQIAAWFSKARSSGNVPVDRVKVRYVKKPNGAKPGMVIFTNNRTFYVDPALPKEPAGAETSK